ncbi:MAG: 3-phosphoshikimate 1-carboxyvinyltransferase, partial [Planctomycetaceae bacterium]
MPPPRTMIPVDSPITGSLRPPGSKSITNRALVIAALADGTSRLSGVLDSRDTEVMIDGLRRLGIDVTHNRDAEFAVVVGCAGRPPVSHAELWLENSGTSIRFLTALCALGAGTYRLDGNTRMRERPIGDLADALRRLGVDVVCETGGDRPPVVVRSTGMAGGRATVSGAISSQFLSALLMSAPCAAGAIELRIDGELVSRPYVDMTRGVMRAFGVKSGHRRSGSHGFTIAPQHYRATDFVIEPDASAAGYFFAAAAVTGGRVTVEGLSRASLQGDVRFVDVLEQMGCRVEWDVDRVTVHGGDLHGVDVDMNAISDTAQTLATVSVFADGPT